MMMIGFQCIIPENVTKSRVLSPKFRFEKDENATKMNKFDN